MRLPIVLVALLLASCSHHPAPGDFFEEISTGKRYRIDAIVPAMEEMRQFREENFRRIEGKDPATPEEKEYLDARIRRLEKEMKKGSEIVRLRDFNVFYIGGLRCSDLVTMERLREDFRLAP